jgi:HNH endonuclease
MKQARDVMLRLIERSVRNPETECVEWMGTRTTGGYGLMTVGSRTDGTRTTKPVHVVAWEYYNGPVPDGLQVCHRCDNPPCWTEAHLFIGTQVDNMADMLAKGRGWQQNVTHCPKGHAYDAENTRHYRGRRHCRACNRLRMRAET